MEREPERGARCTACFKLRLEETAAFASRWNIEHPEEKYDYYCTSLSISPLKDADILNKLGEEMGEKYGIAFLPSDFKKKGRYQRSVELSKQHGLYRQDFCGCEFSRAESIRRKKKLCFLQKARNKRRLFFIKKRGELYGYSRSENH